MNYWHALVYGAVQGVTEYLPISSSAHLILLPRYLEIQDPGLTFDVFLHFGTLFSTLIYFWKDWIRILATVPGIGKLFHPTAASIAETEGLHGPAVNYKYLVIGTVPAVIAGLLIHDYTETVFRGTTVLVFTLSLGGLALWAADHFLPRKRHVESVRWKDALAVGVAQCFALVPGVSRSGSTITGGRLMGLDRASAARFSFLLSAPITAAAAVYKLKDWDQMVAQQAAIGPVIVATVGSFLFGLLAIGGLLRMLRRFGYLSFAVYRVVLAAVVFWAFQPFL